MTRIVHSFSTRPLGIDCYATSPVVRMLGNVVYFALSQAYAKRCGAYTVLHTDSLGAALMGHIPYDEIHLSLDVMPGWVHPRFWAFGKMWALAAESVPCVHIDGDVFLKKPELVESLGGRDSDMTVQSYESGTWYTKEFKAYEALNSELRAVGLDHTAMGAYNTGVLGFADMSLKRRFLDGYFEIVRLVCSRMGQVLDADNDLTPDVIAEQRWAWQCSRDARVRVLIEARDKREEMALADDMGYQHVLTMEKFKHMDKAACLLRLIDCDTYKKTERLCRNVLTR